MKRNHPQVEELIKANILREVKYQMWVSNPVITKKANGRWKLYIDFTYINKARPKENHLLPATESKVEDIHQHRFKCFLDAYKGYHQIPIAEKDEEKTAFHTREGVFCYKRLPFGLKNARSDFEEEMLADIKETLERLQVINLKLNPKKCSFGVEEGRISGNLITKQRIKADPSKVKAISDLQPPKSKDSEIKDREAKRKEPEPKNAWEFFTDKASSFDGSGAGLMMVNPKGKEYTYALRFEFKTTNNEAGYEALLAGLRIAKEMKIQELIIFVESQLVANQVNRLFQARQPAIKQYLEKAKELLASFPTYSIEHIKRDQNKKEDTLSKLASMTFSKLAKEVLVEVLQEKSITQKEVADVTQEEEDNWMIPIWEFLQLGKLLDDPQKARKLRIKALLYKLIDRTLY
ncbi:reverse transcriptase domain-containing protein [Tanacetum coccineum]